MKFYLLASGSKGNCFLLQDEHLNVLVDCGSTKKYLLSAFERIGFSLKDLDAVLITHTHTDHISQIKTFKDYPVYSPVEIDKIDTIRVESEVPFQLQHVTVRPLALSHDAEKTTGYIFETWLEKLVYITDTGYVKDKYLPLLTGADYIILESNHDIEKLMCTSRPYYVKQRIASDSGHLCNEDAANILDKIVTEKTKMIVLAHISEEANTREKALEVTCNTLMKHRGSLNKDLIVCSAGQFEIEHGGDNSEKIYWVLAIGLLGWNIILTASLMSIIKNTSTKDETDNSGTAIISHTVHGYTTELTDAVEKVQSKIVTVNIFSEETNKSLTGVIYASNSNGTYIVTSASLLSEEETITVKFDNNISLKAELIGLDKDTDVAVLFVKPEFDTDAITLGDSDILKTGEYVFALSGRPEETDAGIASFGVISSNIQTGAASNKHINEVLFSDVVETDITDGAPLFNVNGDMIGMLTKEVVVTSYSKYSAAISINELKLVADEIISSEVVDRGYLGVIGRNISDIKAYEKGSYGLQLDIADGILVTRVVENSPAMQAGILMNDVVVGINENEVRSLKDLRNFLYNAKPEDSVNITLNRFGNLITVTVVLQ